MKMELRPWVRRVISDYRYFRRAVAYQREGGSLAEGIHLKGTIYVPGPGPAVIQNCLITPCDCGMTKKRRRQGEREAKARLDGHWRGQTGS